VRERWGKAKWRETETKGSSLIEEAGGGGWGCPVCARWGERSADVTRGKGDCVRIVDFFQITKRPQHIPAHEGRIGLYQHHKIDQKTKMQSLYCPSVTLLISPHLNIKEDQQNYKAGIA
jgi:hypothetical protein